jgi:hypothetical protein
VNYDAAHPDHVGGLRHAARGVAKQGAADTVPLPVLIHRQAGEYGDRNGIGHFAPKSTGGRINGDHARSKCVTSDYLIAATNDEGA